MATETSPLLPTVRPPSAPLTGLQPGAHEGTRPAVTATAQSDIDAFLQEDVRYRSIYCFGRTPTQHQPGSIPVTKRNVMALRREPYVSGPAGETTGLFLGHVLGGALLIGGGLLAWTSDLQQAIKIGIIVGLSVNWIACLGVGARLGGSYGALVTNPRRPRADLFYVLNIVPSREQSAELWLTMSRAIDAGKFRAFGEDVDSTLDPVRFHALTREVLASSLLKLRGEPLEDAARCLFWCGAN